MLPVEDVRWWSAVRYANMLSAEYGLESCYVLTDCGTSISDSNCDEAELTDLDCTGYRLPTETEWEYMARGGTTTDYYSGDVSRSQSDCEDAPSHLYGIAYFCDNSGDETHVIRGRTPNAYGLYDVAGNVSEWVWDRWGRYPVGPQTDWTGPGGLFSGNEHIHRGGSYDSDPADLQHGSRDATSPSSSDKTRGFRLVRTVVLD